MPPRAQVPASVGVDPFETVGGLHWPFAALCDALACDDVLAPHTRKPLSEPMLLGLSGGIAAGYALSPPLKGYDARRGVSMLGRRGGADPSGAGLAALLKRIGGRVQARETGGRGTAVAHLAAALGRNRPAFVWCAPPRMAAGAWAGSFGTYVLLVRGLDRARGTVEWSDRPRTALAMPLRELAALRARVKAHRHRVATYEPPQRLTLAVLREATRASIRECADELLARRPGPGNLRALLAFAREIASPSHPRGWPSLFPGGRLFVALRDLHDSIETAGTGGGLYRHSYAEFLDEAAKLTGIRALRASAKSYRQLAADWSGLADDALPDRIAPFRGAKRLLAQREREFLRGGARVAERVDEALDAMRALTARMRARFPLDHTSRMELLTDLSERVVELHAAEEQAARALRAAVR